MLSADAFAKSSRYTSGRAQVCKECFKKYNAEYRKRPEVKARRALRVFADGHHRSWSDKTIRAHRLRGVVIKFSRADLQRRAEATLNCELCGKKLSWKFGKEIPQLDSPTLDNINLKRELTLDDVMIVCKWCNSVKNRRTLAEFMVFCRRQLAYHKVLADKYRVILDQNNMLVTTEDAGDH